MGSARRLLRRLHPHDPAAPQGRRCRNWCAGSRRRGDVYEGFYEGWYCVGCEAFKQEKDLVDGKCPLHSTVDWIKEKNHFFRLSKYREPLLAHIAAHPEFIEPDARRNEILRLLESGLDDISISRAGQSWGIPRAARSVERGLRVVRRADQLRGRRRLRHRRGDVREVVAGRPARHRQGHHPVPHGDLAGDADERGDCRCRGRSSGTGSCRWTASG